MLNDAIQRTYLLQGLTSEQVEVVASIAHVRDFMGGETIVRQFATGTDVAIVLQGKVIVKGFSGETLAEGGPGSVVGEMALVDGMPRSANVVSVGHSRVAILDAEGLRNLMAHDAEIARSLLGNLCRILSMRLRTASIQLDVTQAKVAETA